MYKLSSLLLTLLLAMGANATQCAGPMTACSLYGHSTLVFRGRAVDVIRTPVPSGTVTNPDGSETVVWVSGPETGRVRFEVLEVFRGDPGREITINMGRSFSDFNQGGEYLIFASLNDATKEFMSGFCSGDRRVPDAQADADLAWLRAYPTAPPKATIFGAMSIPHHDEERIEGFVALSGTETHRATPDENNSYRFKDLAPGTYTVTARVADGMVTDGPQTVTVVAKGCAEVDWQVKYDSHIKGTVTDSSGKPLGGISVALLAPSPSSRSGSDLVTRESTDAQGEYDISKVEPGDYWVVLYPWGPNNREPYLPVFYPSASTPSGATLLHLAASETLEGINLVLPDALQPVVVRARVRRRDGTPVDRAKIAAVDTTSNLGHEFIGATADTAGYAAIKLYAGREYYLTASGEGQPPCAGPVKFIAREGLVLLTLDKSFSECRAYSRTNPCPACTR